MRIRSTHTRRHLHAVPPRRRPAPRPPGLLSQASGDVTTATMDAAAEAERLMADLLALVDAGLVDPFSGDGVIRYASAEASTDPAA